jgi:hypothetical protein
VSSLWCVSLRHVCAWQAWACAIPPSLPRHKGDDPAQIECPISSSFTSAAPAFDSDVAGKAVPLGPYSRLLSGRLPQLGPYVTFERGARPISGHETGGSGHRTAVYLRSSAAGTSFIGPGAGAVPGAGWGNAVDAAVWKVMLPFF